MSSVRQRLNIRVHRIRSSENSLLPGMNGVRRTPAGDLAIAVTHINNGGVARLIHIDAIAAGTKNGEREIRSIDFDRLVLRKASHANA